MPARPRRPLDRWIRAHGLPYPNARVSALARTEEKEQWSYDDVSAHADSILERLQEGSMPCDGAWPAERVAVFARWVETGKAE